MPLSSIIRTLAAIVLVTHTAARAEFLFYEHEPIGYTDAVATDRIAAMVEDYQAGRLELDTKSERGFLHSLLKHLNVPTESQVLVFSKTSLQSDRITSKTPRALYYNDELYIGWVQGGDVEIIAHDPQLGPVFYRMETPFGRSGGGRRLFRDRRCLDCHGSSRTDGYPGMLVRSVKADAIGAVIFGAGTHRTNHSSPLRDRWGGWFVTGENAGDRHLGNLVFEEGKPGEAIPHLDYGARPRDLKAAIDTSPYLAPGSDIVALMVMEHQITAQNALAKAHLDTRRWLHLDAALGEQLGRKPGEVGESTLSLIGRGADELLKVMLFADEAELEGWGVEGGEAFQEAFATFAKPDSEDRSLRDFQLLSRLFKHRLSYTIYSPAFTNLHPMMKAEFYRRLDAALAGKSESAAHLGDKERQRIVTILLETMDDLPKGWGK